MKNLMIVLTLILGVSIFSSCSKEECETCTYTFMWVDAEGNELTDYTENEEETEAKAGVMGTDANGDLCDDALADAKTAFEGMDDYANGMRSGDATEGHEEECCADPADPEHDAYHEAHDPTAAWTYTMTCVEVE